MHVRLPRSTARRVASLAIGVAAAALTLVVTPGTASATATVPEYGGSYGGYGGGYDGGYGGSYGGGYDGGYGGSYGGSYDTGYSGSVVVSPLLDCITTNRDGSYTAVLGYKNTSSSTYSITGSYNQISPSSYDGRQPTSFKPGTYHGVFSLTIPSGTVYWNLAEQRLTISRTAAGACSAGTSLPASGNGTGIAIGLAAAGVLGAVVVRRARRAARPVPVAG